MDGACGDIVKNFDFDPVLGRGADLSSCINNPQRLAFLGLE